MGARASVGFRDVSSRFNCRRVYNRVDHSAFNGLKGFIGFRDVSLEELVSKRWAP